MKAIKAKILSKVTALSMVWSSVLLTACMMSSIPDVTEVSERVLVNQSKGVSLLVYNDYRKPVILIEDSVPDWIVVKGLTSNTLNPLTAANLDLVIYCGANEEVRTATVLLKSPDNEVSKSINVSLECYSPNGGPAFPFLPPFGPNPFPSPTPEPAPPTTSPGTGLGPQPIVGDGSDGAYYVSTSGSDSNSGTLSRPFKTIEAAASRARPGDVIYIRGGVYPRTKIQGVHGQAGKPVTFRAFPGERVVLDGKTKGALNQENNVLWLYDKVSYVVFDGLEITDTNPDIDVMRRLDLNKEADVNEFLKKWASGINSKYPMGVRINPNGETGDIHDIVFKNMKVHHILNLGISIQNDTRNVTIENCYFANLGYPRSGYAVYTHNNGFIFRNNIVHTATYGLHIFSEHDHYMTNVRIENNLFHNIGWWPYYHISSKKVKPAGGRAIMLNKYGDNAVVRNNIIHNARTGIRVEEFTNTLIEHNLVYDGNNGYDISSKGVDVVNNIAHSLKSKWLGSEQPRRFANNLEIQMRLNDPEKVEKGVTGFEQAIDKGTKTGTTKDILGNSRSLGAAPDVGPFEIL